MLSTSMDVWAQVTVGGGANNNTTSSDDLSFLDASGGGTGGSSGEGSSNSKRRRTIATKELSLKSAVDGLSCLPCIGGSLSADAVQSFAVGDDGQAAILGRTYLCIKVDSSNGRQLHSFDYALNEPRKIVYVPAGLVPVSCYIVLDSVPNAHISRLQLFDHAGRFITKLTLENKSTPKISVMELDVAQCHLMVVDSRGLVSIYTLEQMPLLKLKLMFRSGGIVNECTGIAAYGENYYLCDYRAHCVVVFSKEGNYIGKFGSFSVTPYPVGIDVSRDGDIVVGDSHGNHFHVTIFGPDWKILQQYTYMSEKVSRCTGLKLVPGTNYVVTLSRLPGKLMVFDKLYVPLP